MPITPCANCEKPLERFASQIAFSRQYCDKTCMREQRQKDKVAVTCVICGTIVRVSPSRVHQYSTCSSKCKGIYMRQNQVQWRGSSETRNVNCYWCGKAFTRKPSQIAKYKTSYCSKACMNLGIKQLQHTDKDYAPGFTRSLKTKVRMRDNYTCQKCYRDGSRVLVHHIDGTKSNHNIDNLVCLCDFCHQQLHHGLITYP